MHPMMKLLVTNRRQGQFQVSDKSGADEATIYLYDMIVNSEAEAEWFGGVSPQAFVKALNEIDAATIHLRVNSPGGSVFAARAMEQAIREHKSTVVVHVDGLAASAASFLIMAADEIRMAPGSFLMIHKAWSMSYGNADDFRKEAGLLDQVDGTLVKTYAKRTGREDEEIAAWLADETWFEAEKAVELGFADQVADEETPKAASPKWDLAAYSNAPDASPDIQPPDPTECQVDRVALRRQVLKALIPA